MLMNYYRSIDRTRVQFDFLVHRNDRGEYEDEIEALGGRVYRMPPITPGSMIRYNRRMKQFLSEHKEYKIIHSHIDTLSSLPLKAAMESGVPVRIAHCHSQTVNKDFKAPVRMLLKRSVTQYANYYFACSRKAGLWFFGQKYKDQIHVLKNAIHASDYIYNSETADKVRGELNLKGKLVIGHVGNFTKPKNHSFLIDIFGEICEVEKNACLLLVGDGELRGKAENKAARMGLKDKVIFLGFRSDIPRLLQAMDLFVFPSLYEGLPVALIEAQASGLPCIVSDRVTDEARVTDPVEFLALEDGPKPWAEKAMAYSRGFERDNTCQRIIEANFDTGSSAKQLQDFYIGLVQQV